jgi:Tfp pilus assembly protein PilZ
LEVAVQVPGPEASAEAIATRLRAMGEEVGPMLRATQHGLGTLPGLLQSLVAVLERMDSRFAQGVVPVAAEAMAAAPAAPAQGLPQALPYAPAPQVPAPSSQPPRPQSQRPPAPHPQHPQAQHPQAQHPQAQHPRHLQAQHPQAQHPQAQHPQAQHPQAPHPQAGAPAGGGRFPTPLPTPTASMPPAARPRFDVELGRTSDANLYLPPGMELDIVRDGGVFVPSRKALPLVGSSVILAVHVAGAPKFETTAVVTWRTEGQPEGPPAGFGARFPYLSGAQEALVRRYFAERPPIVLRSS